MALVAKFGSSPVLDCLHSWRKGGVYVGWLSQPIRFGAKCAARCVLRVVGCGALFIPPGANGAPPFIDTVLVSGYHMAWPKKLRLGQTFIAADYSVRPVKANDAPKTSTRPSLERWRGADN